jgi:hypothetical protein
VLEHESRKKAMKIRELTTEAPLADYQPLGDFERGKGGFRHAVDKQLVTNPVTIGKAYKFFSRTPYDIRIFPVQVRGGGGWLETGEVDNVTLSKIVGADNARRILAGQGPDNITIVFTNNTGAERVPLTPWMMAHRMGHAMRRRIGGGGDKSWYAADRHFWHSINTILRDYYGITNITPEIENALLNAIGTMRSARQRRISRNWEMVYELLAQYLNTGEVTFNPAPAELVSRRQAWGHPRLLRRIGKTEQQEASQMLETLSYDMELMFNDVMSNALGRIYVM